MAAGKAHKPRKAAPKIAAVADEIRCEHVDAQGQRCPAAYVSGHPFCRKHAQEVADVATMQENNAVGSAAEAEQMRAELEQLRAQNAVLATQMKRLLAVEPPAPAAPPAEDPAVAAERLAAAQQGRGPAKPGATVRRGPRKMDVPLEAEAHQRAVALLREAQEKAYAEREARARERRRRGLPADEGRIPIEMQIEIPPQLDPSAMVDRLGNNLVPPGYVPRWIRMYNLDASGHKEPSTYRADYHRLAWGAKKVMEPQYDDNDQPTGETVHKKGLLGEAWMIPVDMYAKRIIHWSKHGSFDDELDKEYGRLDNVAEAENRRYGKRGGAVHLQPAGGGDDSAEGQRWFDAEQPPTHSGWKHPE